ncbi:LmeA family phospholipid-binding protein [Gordonia sp. DT219]|uniref:LmeA family phospholipid-binding protein n=1 Tax=Gordonia sp. DT219 TaxID=3416658 RepID=UPI003CF645C8
MADDTTDEPRTPAGHEDPDITKRVGRGDDASAAPSDEAASPVSGPPEAGSAASGSAASSSAASGDPSPDTEQWETATTAQHSRAYSQIGEATTTPVTPPPPEPRPQTTQFTTGQNPVGSGGFAPAPPAGGPPTGSSPTGPGVVTSAPGRRRTGRFIVLGVVGLVLVIIIALVGSELYLRSRATDCLEQQFGALTGQPTNVSISKKPVLLQKFSNNYPYVQVDTSDSNATQMQLHARADGVSQNGGSVKVDSLSGTGFVPFQRVIEMSKQGQLAGGGSPNGGGNNGANDPTTGAGGAGILSGTQVSAVTGNAADGTIKVDASVQVAIFPVPVSLTMKPVVDQGRVRFQVEQASAFAFGIPADFAQQFVDGFGDSLFGELTKEIKVSSLKVTDSGVDFAVTGKDVDLSSAGGSGAGSGASCSIL